MRISWQYFGAKTISHVKSMTSQGLNGTALIWILIFLESWSFTYPSSTEKSYLLRVFNMLYHIWLNKSVLPSNFGPLTEIHEDGPFAARTGHLGLRSFNICLCSKITKIRCCTHCTLVKTINIFEQQCQRPIEYHWRVKQPPEYCET